VCRYAAFANARPSVLIVAAVWAASRTAMAIVAVTVPYARPGGLAAAFIDGGEHRWVIFGLGLCGALALAVAWKPVAGVVTLCVVAAGAGSVVALAWRRIGGFTGDVLGAMGVVGETAGLLAAAAKW
jgi:adenosylcobinamide-GDP ribazoletransferase